MSQPVIYRTPPIAGRPPYATDEPDSVYQQQPSPSRKMRQPPPPNPNDRTSAYNMYDQYLDGASGTSNIDNPFDDSKQFRAPPPIPLAAPKPGYAAPVAALNLARPIHTAIPEGRRTSPSIPLSPEMPQTYPKPLTLVSRQASPISGNFPHTPHELQPPMTPIAPAFIRPSSAASSRRDVKFSSTQPILRGEKEETLLPKRGQGEDFWRRFSMVAKEENTKHGKQSQSAWLRKTTSGSHRHSRWVWCMGMLILIIIIIAICVGVFKSKTSTSTSTTVVTAIGGSENEADTSSSSAAAAGTAGLSSSTYLHVSPTNTVARRDVLSDAVPTSIPFPVMQVGSESRESVPVARIFTYSHRHRRSHLNRTLD